MQNFADEKHAWLTGLVTGHLSKSGVEVGICTDDDGDTTPTIEVLIPDFEEIVSLRVCIPEDENPITARFMPAIRAFGQPDQEWEAPDPPAIESGTFTVTFAALPGQDLEEAYHALAREMAERYGLEEIG